jgi:Beta propeller domain
MTGRFPLATIACLAAAALITAGCTGDPSTRPSGAPPAAVPPAGGFRLVAFDSCQDALRELKQAAKQHVGPYGFMDARRAAMASAGGAEMATDSRLNAAAPPPGADLPGAAAAPEAAGAPGTGAPGGDYSGTNTHEAGVDEPDVVKTDGRRIVTVTRGVLRVVDPAARKVTGELDLATATGEEFRGADATLLLSGDHALVLLRDWGRAIDMPVSAARPDTRALPAVPPTDPEAVSGPRLLLVDLSGKPRLLSSYTMDGSLADVRQVGATARVVVRSWPRLAFPYAERATDQQRLAANRAIIDAAGADDWLPRYAVTTGGRTEQGQVDCGSVNRPARYTGASMVTVLTFDLGAEKLGNGDPVSVVADGDIVYSNGRSLYVANYQYWGGQDGTSRPQPADPSTEIYKFDTPGAERPRYAAAGSVPGKPINQYHLSEWDGHLRVATTRVAAGGAAAKVPESAVYVLRQDGKSLVQTSHVGGLGKGEQIYAVRFVGPVGYVVTFRRTDPLYTVDLSDPARPRVAGELKITGYSAYLHPAADGRLIGVGQEASTQGRIQGTQVSLFDVADLDRPNRLAQYHVKDGNSEAEHDPHAFLYWPADRLLVIPLVVYGPDRASIGNALVLKVGDNTLTEAGTITQQGDAIRRSLVVDGALWTLSDAGLQATNMSTLDKLAWVELT